MVLCTLNNKFKQYRCSQIGMWLSKLCSMWINNKAIELLTHAIVGWISLEFHKVKTREVTQSCYVLHDFLKQKVITTARLGRREHKEGGLSWVDSAKGLCDHEVFCSWPSKRIQKHDYDKIIYNEVHISSDK